MNKNLLFSMILAASAMPAGAQGVAATANWVTPINANNGISTPETVRQVTTTLSSCRNSCRKATTTR